MGLTMYQYILRRILQALPVLFGITLITFTFTELAPGDAVAAMVMEDQRGLVARGASVEELRAALGLDVPAPLRYLRWLGSLLRGNLGRRLLTRTLVADEIFRRAPATVELMFTSLVISILLGIPLGVIAALYQYSWFDNLTTAFTFFAISVPSFFAAIGAIYLLTVQLHLLPSSGYSTPGRDFGSVGGFFDHLKYLVLPATVLGLGSIAGIMRYLRSSMLETIQADYVTVARAKGLRERTVIMRHAFRNAVLPIVTIIGLRLPSLLGGSLIMERIFNWPGLSQLYMQGVEMRDYPLIMGMTVLSAGLIVVSNLITDIAYGLVDPRIRYE